METVSLASHTINTFHSFLSQKLMRSTQYFFMRGMNSIMMVYLIITVVALWPNISNAQRTWAERYCMEKANGQLFFFAEDKYHRCTEGNCPPASFSHLDNSRHCQMCCYSNITGTRFHFSVILQSLFGFVAFYYY